MYNGDPELRRCPVSRTSPMSGQWGMSLCTLPPPTLAGHGCGVLSPGRVPSSFHQSQHCRTPVPGPIRTWKPGHLYCTPQCMGCCEGQPSHTQLPLLPLPPCQPRSTEQCPRSVPNLGDQEPGSTRLMHLQPCAPQPCTPALPGPGQPPQTALTGGLAAPWGPHPRRFSTELLAHPKLLRVTLLHSN